MQYRILMTTLAVAMTVPSMAAQAAEAGSTWSAKTLSMSSSRAWIDGPNYSFHRTGSFGAAPAPALAMVSAAPVNSDIAGVGDYLGNTSMFADITPISTSVSGGPSFASPNRVVRSSEAASEASPGAPAGLFTDSEGLMTLLAGVGVIGFLAFKRGGAQSRY